MSRRRRFKLPLDFGEGPRLQRATGRRLRGGGWAAPGERPRPMAVWELALAERENRGKT